MKVGDNFSSYSQFQRALSAYKATVLNEFWIKDSRSLMNQRMRYPDTVASSCNEKLKYYNFKLCCVKGGRLRGKTSRRTLKQDCPAFIFLRLSSCQQFLTVSEINDQHNHDSSQAQFKTLSQQRRVNEARNASRKLSTIDHHLPSVFPDAHPVLDADKELTLALNSIMVGTGLTGLTIKLEDLINLNIEIEKKALQELVSHMQINYQCETVEIFKDRDGMFKGLFFQDQQMKTSFEAYPEMLFVENMHCFNDNRPAVYVLMIEDGNGLSDIVALCLLVEESEESTNFVIETFNENNKLWDHAQIIMFDNDRTKRKVLEKHFHQSRLMISLFHTFESFNKAVSIENISLTIEEVQQSKQYLQQLAYAKSEDEYNSKYIDMCDNVPTLVKEYYDTHWEPVKRQWVKCYSFKNLCLTNENIVRLEGLNNKLKNMINKDSTLADFIKYFFSHLNTWRAEKDLKLWQELNKKITKVFTPGSPQALYSSLLTTIAFQKVEEQFVLRKRCRTFKPIEEGSFSTITSEGLLHITATACKCLFFTANKLPCRHIFRCRDLLCFDLFDENLCLKRWTRLYACEILQQSETEKEDLAENKDGRVINKPSRLNYHQKSKIMDNHCKELATLCSAIPDPIFHKRVEVIKKIISLWSSGRDEDIKLPDNIPVKMPFEFLSATTSSIGQSISIEENELNAPLDNKSLEKTVEPMKTECLDESSYTDPYVEGKWSSLCSNGQDEDIKLPDNIPAKMPLEILSATTSSIGQSISIEENESNIPSYKSLQKTCEPIKSECLDEPSYTDQYEVGKWSKEYRVKGNTAPLAAAVNKKDRSKSRGNTVTGKRKKK